MKYFKFIVIGIIFGIMLYKVEAVSRFRTYGMFHFQSFHMYAIIFSGVILGAIIMNLMKRGIILNIMHEPTVISKKSHE